MATPLFDCRFYEINFMSKISIPTFLTFALVLLSPLIKAQEIKVGIMKIPPYYLTNEGQPPSGIFLDIMKKSLEHAGLNYRIDDYPTKRLYLNLGSGKTDLFLGIKGSPEYDDKVFYSKTIISQIQMRIYATGDTPLPITKEDINGHKISTMRGYGYGGLVNYFSDPSNNIEVALTSEHLASFQMLKKERIEYVMTYKHIAEIELKNFIIPQLKYTNFYTLDAYFIVSKSTPNAFAVLQKIERAYLDLVELGEFEYIENNN
jgi:ABC-type amino acid transport substrate-binding protein